MYNKFLARLVETLREPRQPIYPDDPLNLYNIYSPKSVLTFQLEVIDVILSDDESSLLHPVVLVELLHLAAHHNYFLLG